MNGKSITVGIAIVMLALSGIVGVVAADTSYDVELNATDSGNASALDVFVGSNDENHDLIANGSYNTTLSNGTVITVEYVNSTGSVTDSTSYTVEGGTTTLTVGDATVDYTEKISSNGGGGGSGGAGIPDWLVQSVVGAIAVAAVFRWLDINKGGRR